MTREAKACACRPRPMPLALSNIGRGCRRRKRRCLGTREGADGDGHVGTRPRGAVVEALQGWRARMAEQRHSRALVSQLSPAFAVASRSAATEQSTVLCGSLANLGISLTLAGPPTCAQPVRTCRVTCYVKTLWCDLYETLEAPPNLYNTRQRSRAVKCAAGLVWPRSAAARAPRTASTHHGARASARRRAPWSM